MRRTKTVANKYEDVIKAFAEGREMRGKLVSNGGKAHYWASGRHSREGIRDQVKREDGVLTYYLWGSPIATLDGDVLTLDNCGYATVITVARLSKILETTCRLRNISSPASCHKAGWSIGFWDTKHESYPLEINVRAGELLTKPDMDKQYAHLGRMRCPYKIREAYDALKRFAPVPPEIEDKVMQKLLIAKLTEATR